MAAAVVFPGRVLPRSYWRVGYDSVGVDVPEDVARVEALLRSRG